MLLQGVFILFRHSTT